MIKKIKSWFSNEALKQYKINETYNFNDTLPSGCPDNNYIGDKIFESSIIIFNVGFVPNYRMYNVVVVPYKQKLDF